MTVIAACVALDHALERGDYPEAHHHARMAVLRSERGRCPQIAEPAHAPLAVLHQAIRPSPTAWRPVLKQMYDAIDGVLRGERQVA